MMYVSYLVILDKVHHRLIAEASLTSRILVRRPEQGSDMKRILQNAQPHSATRPRTMDTNAAPPLTKK